MDNDLYLEKLAESDSMDVAQQNTLTSRLNPRGLYKSAQRWLNNSHIHIRITTNKAR